MRPAEPPAYAPTDPRYADPRDLEDELARVFSICHGCRMCVGFCPAFPEMFRRVDGYVDRGKGEIEAFDQADFQAVNDLCYQCKLCHFKCPYTPDDEHPFMLDFPRLMLRHKAQRAQSQGVALQDQALGEPQLLGRLGSGPAAPMANLISSNRLLRKVQQAATGISAEFPLPPFAGTTLEHWWRDREASRSPGERGTVALFATCTTNYNLPAAGIAAVQVLEHNGFYVDIPSQQTCCGMPNLDGGDVPSARAKAERNVSVLFPFVEQGFPVVVPGPTCSYVLKQEYPDLLGTAQADAVAERTFDLMEFLRDLMRKNELRLDFSESLGRVGYHAPCHLRAQKVGFPTMQLLRKVPDTEVHVVQECSAVDGTWGMKAQFYELGRQYAKKLVREMSAKPFDKVATDCPLSGLRLLQELNRTAVHPIELLNEAYGLPHPAEATR